MLTSNQYPCATIPAIAVRATACVAASLLRDSLPRETIRHSHHCSGDIGIRLILTDAINDDELQSLRLPEIQHVIDFLPANSPEDHTLSLQQLKRVVMR